MERFEPSTLAGLVFETSAYTIPPHRPVKRVHAIQPNHKNHRNKRKTPLTKRSIPYLVKACNQRKRPSSPGTPKRKWSALRCSPVSKVMRWTSAW